MKHKRTIEFWLVALFLSKYSKHIKGKTTEPPSELEVTSWNDAYYMFYDHLGSGYSKTTFINSLKNCRDAFDGYITSSGRAGWKQQNGNPMKLPKLALSIFNDYKNMSRENLWSHIQELISNQYKSQISTISNIRTTNPDWTREELILALDLYFRLDQGQMHKGHPEVIRLSNELRELNIHHNIIDPTKFRNPSSVSRRLGNFKSMDIGYKGKGLKNTGKLAKEIFNEFSNNRNKLIKEADLIRQVILKSKKETKVLEENKYNTVFFYNYHKNRENDPLLFMMKSEIVLAKQKKLKCEVCGFDPISFYGEIGNNLMEIHYNKQLRDEREIVTSDINDFIIVCSNCHKTLDRNFGLLDANDLKRLIQKSR